MGRDGAGWHGMLARMWFSERKVGLGVVDGCVVGCRVKKCVMGGPDVFRTNWLHEHSTRLDIASRTHVWVKEWEGKRLD